MTAEACYSEIAPRSDGGVNREVKGRGGEGKEGGVGGSTVPRLKGDNKD